MFGKTDERIVKKVKEYLSKHPEGVKLWKIYEDVEKELREMGISPSMARPKNISEKEWPRYWYQLQINRALSQIQAKAEYRDGEYFYFL